LVLHHQQTNLPVMQEGQIVKMMRSICTIKVLDIRISTNYHGEIRNIIDIFQFESESFNTFIYSPEGWSGQGCQTRIINSSLTECLCNHLTHFAVLMDYADSGDSGVSFISS